MKNAQDKEVGRKLAIEQLRREYGLGDETRGTTRGSCTITMQCATHTISCTSSDGDCKFVQQDIIFEDEVLDKITTEIICDGKSYKCV